MASVSGDAGTQPPVSGGKIVRARRKSGPRTPYDRPRSRNSVRENPNWVSRFVYHPTRAIASSAGKVLTYVFFSESSSSSSSSNVDTDSDGYTDNDIEDSNVCCSEHETSDKTDALEISNGPANDQQTAVPKSETKHVIEKLVTQEWFVREQPDKLMNINARAVDQPATAVMEDERQKLFSSGGGNDVNVPDLSSKTASEEKKLDSGAKYKLESKDGAGSPTDMAKSYMRTRPPWASPSLDILEFRSPSPTRMPLYNGSYLSSSKLKRRSPSGGSWNIQEETRKVRVKATEDMLKNLSSPRTDCHGAASSSCPVTVQDKGQNEALPNPVTVNFERNQDATAGETFVATASVPIKTYLKSRNLSKRVVLDETLGSINGFEDTKTASKSGPVAADADRRSGETTPRACSTAKPTAVVLALEATPDSFRKPSASKEAGNPLARGDFHFSEFSLSARVNAQPKPRQPHEENNRVVDESDNSCSIRQEQLTDDLTLPISVSCRRRGQSRGGGSGRGRGRGRGGGRKQVK